MPESLPWGHPAGFDKPHVVTLRLCGAGQQPEKVGGQVARAALQPDDGAACLDPVAVRLRAAAVELEVGGVPPADGGLELAVVKVSPASVDLVPGNVRLRHDRVGGHPGSGALRLRFVAVAPKNDEVPP